jgi:predicted amidohydrolase
LENRVYAITANRIGEEQRKEGPALRFIGQSRIVSPDGDILIAAHADEKAFMATEITPEKARDKTLNSMNDLFSDRRPEIYLNLTAQKP